jgi:hypothetical protein
MPHVSDQLLVLAAISLRARHQQRRSPDDVWAALPQRVRCLLGGGWLLSRVEKLVLAGALDGYTPDELADEVWRREVVEFPVHPDPQPREPLIRPWVDILRGQRACPHVERPDHPEPSASILISLQCLLEPTPAQINNGVVDPMRRYFLS